jgi:uncharacterized protein involved in exopolysaccharide biosynthesis
MRVGDLVGVLRRRWLLVLVGVLMTIGLSGAGYVLFKPTYEITATVLLLPPAPTAPANGTPNNPYLQLSGLQQVVDLVGVSLTDQATQVELKAISKDVDYTVKADTRTNSPLIVIDVKDSSPETAVRIRDILVARVPVRLAAMQETLAVSAKDRVTSTVLTLDGQAEEVGKNRLRAAVVAGALGLALTLVAATVWDEHRLRHPRRRAARRSPATDQEGPSPLESAVAPAESTVGTPSSSAHHPDEMPALEELADVSDDAR